MKFICKCLLTPTLTARHELVHPAKGGGLFFLLAATAASPPFTGCGGIVRAIGCSAMTVASDELRVFLQQRLASIDQIDVILLLRSDASRSWTATEVAKELAMAPEPAAMRLFLLASAGLIVFEASGVPRYRYVVLDAEVEPLVQELATAYATSRDAVLALVDTRPPDTLRSFADAFKLKK
jgi:hypothetical protein